MIRLLVECQEEAIRLMRLEEEVPVMVVLVVGEQLFQLEAVEEEEEKARVEEE